MTDKELQKLREKANRIQREGGASLRDHMMTTGVPPAKAKKKKKTAKK